MNASIRLLLLLFFFSFSTSIRAQELFLPVQSGSRTAQKYYREAVEALAYGRLDDFDRYMGKAVSGGPGFFMAYWQMALADRLFRNGESFPAFAAKALALSDGDEAARNLLRALQQGGAGLEQQCRALTARFPSVVESHLWCARLLPGPEARLASANRAVQLAPRFAPVYEIQGRAFMAMGSFALAEKAFAQQLKLAPGEGIAYFSMAGCQMELGNYAKAERLYRDAYATDAFFSEAPQRAEVAAAMLVAEKASRSFLAAILKVGLPAGAISPTSCLLIPTAKAPPSRKGGKH